MIKGTSNEKAMEMYGFEDGLHYWEGWIAVLGGMDCSTGRDGLQYWEGWIAVLGGMDCSTGRDGLQYWEGWIAVLEVGMDYSTGDGLGTEGMIAVLEGWIAVLGVDGLQNWRFTAVPSRKS